MIEDKHKALANLLITRTEDKTLDWRRSFSENAFEVSLGNNTVRIAEIPSRESEFEGPDYVITLINKDGVEVDQFSDSDLNAYEAPGHKTWYKRLEGLFKNARRTALGADEVGSPGTELEFAL